MPMTKTQLTTHLGVGRAVIDRLVAEGLPGAADAKTGRLTFDAAQVARWLLSRSEAGAGGPDAERERTRLLRAQADTAELRLERERGGLVPVDAVERAWTQTFSVVRDLLRSMPRAVVDRMMAAAAEGRPALAATLLAEVDDCLTRCSKIEVVIEADEDEADAA